jgi:hypothetical protein
MEYAGEDGVGVTAISRATFDASSSSSLRSLEDEKEYRQGETPERINQRREERHGGNQIAQHVD